MSAPFPSKSSTTDREPCSIATDNRHWKYLQSSGMTQSRSCPSIIGRSSLMDIPCLMNSVRVFLIVEKLTTFELGPVWTSLSSKFYWFPLTICFESVRQLFIVSFAKLAPDSSRTLITACWCRTAAINNMEALMYRPWHSAVFSGIDRRDFSPTLMNT